MYTPLSDVSFFLSFAFSLLVISGLLSASHILFSFVGFLVLFSPPSAGQLHFCIYYIPFFLFSLHSASSCIVLLIWYYLLHSFRLNTILRTATLLDGRILHFLLQLPTTRGTRRPESRLKSTEVKIAEDGALPKVTASRHGRREFGNRGYHQAKPRLSRADR